MAKRILVPLDRTPTAEAIIPLIAAVARAAGATVRLLHVAPVPHNVEMPAGHVIAYADQEMDRLDVEHTEYMRAVAEAHLTGVPTEVGVRFGDAVDEILAEADRFGADLIGVATKTRSSITRALLGSVAEELVRRAPVTVMLVRPEP
jgi:nucleotide-binding universal stress UspA family protein